MPEKRSLTEPVVHPEVGEKVPDSHVSQTKLAREQCQSRTSKHKPKVAEQNELGLSVIVQRAGGIKVVDTTAIAIFPTLAASLTVLLMVIMSSDVRHEVIGPPNQLLSDENHQGVQRRILRQLTELVHHLAKLGGLGLASARHKNHIALHVCRCLVVLAVGELPAEVGHEEGRVDDPAGNVIYERRVGEGAVAALVGNDP